MIHSITFPADQAIILEIKAFLDALDEEREHFGHTFARVLSYKILIIQEDNDGRIIAMSGISEKGGFFIVVRKDKQNRGIGQKIVREAISEAKGRGLDQLSLHVHRSNSKAIHIYRKAGFIPVQVYPDIKPEWRCMFLPLTWKGYLFPFKMLLLSNRHISGIHHAVRQFLRSFGYRKEKEIVDDESAASQNSLPGGRSGDHLK